MFKYVEVLSNIYRFLYSGQKFEIHGNNINII